MKTIYTTGKGDELINPTNYNGEIKCYLDKEALLFEQVANQFDTIVEAGCMTGRYLEKMSKLNKYYVGIDQEARYIEIAKKHAQCHGQALFVCKDIIHLPSILEEHCIDISKTVVQFPFNSFGNIGDHFRTLKTLIEAGINLVIYTYQNNARANNARKNYYERAGFRDIEKLIDNDSVTFVSESGLNSKAVSKDWIKSISQLTRTKFYAFKFSNIGIAYANIDIRGV